MTARRRGRLVDPVAARSSSATPRPARWSARAARRTRTAPRSTRPPGGRRCRRRSTQAGGLDDVAAVAVGGQQHGMVCLDEAGEVVRPALLWNDTRSAGAAADLVAELRRCRRRGPRRSASCRWRRSPSPSCAGWPSTSRTPPRATAAVCLPHDWLTWRLGGAAGLDALRHRPRRRERHRLLVAGDRGATGPTCSSAAFGRDARGARACSARATAAGRPPAGAVLGPGTGDNAAAALGLGAGPATWSCRSAPPAWSFARRRARRPPTRPGIVAGFADATGGYLPLVCTLNAARVLDAAAALLGRRPRPAVAELALSRPGRGRRAGAGALPGGRAHPEPARRHRRAARADAWRPPPRPTWPGPRSRGMLCGLADGARRAGRPGRRRSSRVLLVGGGARSEAVRRIAPAVFGRPVVVPARRASTSPTAPPGRPPGCWPAGPSRPAGSRPGPRRYEADPTPAVPRAVRGGPRPHHRSRARQQRSQPGYYCRRPGGRPGRGGGPDMTKRWRAPPGPLVVGSEATERTGHA